MRKRVWVPMLLLALAAGAFFGIAPGYLENSMNRLDGAPPLAVSPRAAALHQSLQVVDLHSDTLMWQRDMLVSSDRGHEDLPRLLAGNVALQVFSSGDQDPARAEL